MLKNDLDGHAYFYQCRVRLNLHEIGGYPGSAFHFHDGGDVRDPVPENRCWPSVDDGEGVERALTAALNPVRVPGEAVGADIPGIEICLVATLAVTKPEFVGLAFFPIKVGFGLG